MHSSVIWDKTPCLMRQATNVARICPETYPILCPYVYHYLPIQIQAQVPKQGQTLDSRSMGRSWEPVGVTYTVMVLYSDKMGRLIFCPVFLLMRSGQELFSSVSWICFFLANSRAVDAVSNLKTSPPRQRAASLQYYRIPRCLTSPAEEQPTHWVLWGKCLSLSAWRDWIIL